MRLKIGIRKSARTLQYKYYKFTDLKSTITDIKSRIETVANRNSGENWEDLSIQSKC